MNPIFTPQQYELLHKLAFDPRNPGYRPEVKEAPNGDGKIDHAKRYAHIAKKYLDNFPLAMRVEKQLLEGALVGAHTVAIGLAIELGVPHKYLPDPEDSTLRVLEYDHTAGAEAHTDFDLFTLMCYRNLPEFFVTEYSEDYHESAQLSRPRKVNEQFHFGELFELICPSTKATRHRVTPTGHQGIHQYSVVYFAMPPLAAVLPNGQTVAEWLEERKNRSRY